MKHKRIVLAAALAAAALAAHAQVGTHGEAGGVPYGPAQATTPDQPQLPAYVVKNPWSTSYNPLYFFHSTRSRAEVRADLDAGRQAMLAHEGLAPRGTGVAVVPVAPSAY